MNVEFVFVNPRARSTVPARLKAASNLPEQAKSLSDVQVKVAVVALHEVSTPLRAASPGVLAEILPSVATDNAERQIVVFVSVPQRDELQPVNEFGPAVRIAEVPVVLVVGQRRKIGGHLGAIGRRVRSRLRPSGASREEHEQAKTASGSP